MNLQVVHLDNIKPQPWRNGGGVTRELLAWPDVRHWLLRLSVADIERDGPFSAFPGIDRWFAVLSGNGVRLGTPARVVVVGDLPLQFDGAAAPACELVDGPTRDLNLMVRRDAAVAWMQRVEGSLEWPPVQAEADASLRLCGVFTADGCALQRAGRQTVDLPAMSLAWSTAANAGDSWVITHTSDKNSTFAFGCKLLADGRKRDV